MTRLCDKGSLPIVYRVLNIEGNVCIPTRYHVMQYVVGSKTRFMRCRLSSIITLPRYSVGTVAKLSIVENPRISFLSYEARKKKSLHTQS